jgi:hypothetical protein
MWISRFLLALVGGACLVALSAMLTRTAASVAPALSMAGPSSLDSTTVSVAPAPVVDPEARRCLEQTLNDFQVDRVTWLEMEIWQKAQLPGCVYEAAGSYRLAPGQRFRLEIHTHPGEGESTSLSVSDGRTLWQAERTGSGAWDNVTRLNLSEVFALMNGPSGQQLRNEFLQRPHFQGMNSLLRHLLDRLVWAKSERLRRADGEVFHLIGVWSKEEASRFIPPDYPWPAALPRQCHLYLDAKTYWPKRLEWWGPSTNGGVDHLLVQMEFRNPVFNRSLPAAECNRLFTFHPGEADIEDQTPTVTAEMTKRAGELSPRPMNR